MKMIEALIHLLSFAAALTWREVAVGYTAYYFGDDTPKKSGRLTLNPIHHIDPIGTLLSPAIFFLAGSPCVLGWARPMPFSLSKIKPQRLGSICVAASGTLLNFMMAFVAAVLLHVNRGQATLGNDILIQLIRMNVVLGVFHLLPLPPLDGGRILVHMLPQTYSKHLQKIELYTPLILMGLFLSPLIFQILHIHFDLLEWIILQPSMFVIRGILWLSGHG